MDFSNYSLRSPVLIRISNDFRGSKWMWDSKRRIPMARKSLQRWKSDWKRHQRGIARGRWPLDSLRFHLKLTTEFTLRSKQKSTYIKKSSHLLWVIGERRSMVVGSWWYFDFWALCCEESFVHWSSDHTHGVTSQYNLFSGTIFFEFSLTKSFTLTLLHILYLLLSSLLLVRIRSSS